MDDLRWLPPPNRTAGPANCTVHRNARHSPWFHDFAWCTGGGYPHTTGGGGATPGDTWVAAAGVELPAGGGGAPALGAARGGVLFAMQECCVSMGGGGPWGNFAFTLAGA